MVVDSYEIHYYNIPTPKQEKFRIQ